MKSSQEEPIVEVLLYNIRSAHNVGSIFRTSDACGVSKLYLFGVTPDPIDRFLIPRKDIAKVALGAEYSVLWEHIDALSDQKQEYKTLVDFCTTKKSEGYTVICLEQTKRGIVPSECLITHKTLLIIGEEVFGIPLEVVNICDVCVELPMKGIKESLNVSVAYGIALYALRRLC